MKSIAVALVVPVFMFCFQASAQNEAIESFTAGSIGGYNTDGAGFAFSPVVPIAVTALGASGSDLANYPYQVTLFDSAGSQLASATITTSDAFFNQTYYQNISPVDLVPGDTYYLGSIGVGNGDFWVGNVAASFAPNSDISYLFADAGLMPPGFPPGTAFGDNYFIGQNFQFAVVPEPSVFCLLGAASVLGIFSRQRPAIFSR